MQLIAYLTGLIKKNEIRNLELEINKKTEYER